MIETPWLVQNEEEGNDPRLLYWWVEETDNPNEG